MYLEYIKIKNFGVVEEETIHLQDGLVVVRGRNGAGKTSRCIQSPCYALFGTSSLDANIDDTVRQGEKVSSMQVEVKYGPYVVKRSKSSASVTGPDVKISGQSEVSNFFYKLFGIIKGTEKYVLVSDQGDAAGILRGKPGEVTSLIEDLAGFNQIDELIDKVSEKFPHGSKAVLEERIIDLKEQLDTLDNEPREDPKGKEEEIIKLNTKIEETKLLIEFTAKEMKEMSRKLFNINKSNGEYKTAAEVIKEKEYNKDKIISKLQVLEEKSYQEFNKDEIKEASKLLDSAVEARERWLAYNWVTSCDTSLEETDQWEGSIETFKFEVDDIEKAVKKGTEARTTLKLDIKNKQSRIITDKKCSECGQDVTHLHEEINARIEIELSELAKKLKEVEHKLSKDEAYLKDLKVIKVIQDRQDIEAVDYLKYTVVNKEVVPYEYKWIGGMPTRIDDSTVQKANALIQAYNATETKKKETEKIARALKKELVEIAEEIAEKLVSPEYTKGVTETDNLETEIASKLSEHKSYTDRNIEMFNRTQELSTEIKLIEQSMKFYENKVEEINEQLKVVRSKLKLDGRNAKLIQNVRNAKPIVLNTVWNKVLLVVSTTFSAMLDREAVVERTPKGFRVNGLPVARLSGSEKSTLGIALRSALRDIFAPGCGTIFLDEVAADADKERTFKILAAVKAIPGQKIFITHEEISSTVADQLIEVNSEE